MKGKINNNTIIVGNFNILLTTMDRSTEQKINKETQTLNDTIDQLDLLDICRTFYPITINFTFFSSAHGTFSRIEHILSHKASLGKFKKKLKSFQASFLTTLSKIRFKSVHSEGDQPWDYFGSNDAKAEMPVLWPPHAKS